jgi:hypothetical protein
VTSAPKFHFLMRDLAHELEAGRMTELEAAGRVALHIQQTLDCMHVTFWSVSGEPGRRVMRSVAAFDGTTQRIVRGGAAFPEAGGGFFGALVLQGCFVSGDTFADAALQGVRQTMLEPFNIRALLAASYGDRGVVWGLISCTSSVVRRWKPSEIAALRKCAAEVSALRARRRALGNWLATGTVLS